MERKLVPEIRQVKKQQSENVVILLAVVLAILLAGSVFFLYEIWQLKIAKSGQPDLNQVQNNNEDGLVKNNNEAEINDEPVNKNQPDEPYQGKARRNTQKFSGANDYIALADNVFNKVGPNGTIMAYFKAAEIPADRNYVFAAQNLEDVYVTRMWLGVRNVNGENKLDIEWVGDRNSDRIDMLYDIEPNKWYLVAYTADVSGNKLYINGEKVEVEYGAGNKNSNVFFHNSVGGVDDVSQVKYDIGCLYYQPGNVEQGFFESLGLGQYLPEIRCFNFFQGEIEHVSVWERALTADEVKQYYDEKIVKNKDGLLAWWDLADYDGDKIIDQSGKGNEGVINGFDN